MSIWGKLAGAAAGLAVGGPIGALLGGVAGHYVIDRDKEEDGPAENQVAFTVGVIALGAKMAKADGVVTMDEVNAFKEVFKVPDGEMKNVARVFNLAKQDVAGYEAYAEQLATMFKGNRKLLEDVLEGLFHIAKADDALHPREEQFLGRRRQALRHDRHRVRLYQGAPRHRRQAQSLRRARRQAFDQQRQSSRATTAGSSPRTIPTS